MEIKEGYLYHIKDEFFDVVNDSTLMANHEKGRQRQTYFVIKENEILWFIPLSTKVEKYQKIVDYKLMKHKKCETILIRKIFKKKSAILIQNTFPTLEKYISHVHTIKGIPKKVSEDLKNEILETFNNLMHLKHKGKNLFFTDIDKIKAQMLEELEKDKQKQIAIN